MGTSKRLTLAELPIVRANEDDGVITFLYVKQVGTSLRHFGRHFGRQRAKLNVRWHGVANRLWGIVPRLRQIQVLYIFFDNESLLLGQIDGARLGGDRRLISVLRPQDMLRRREGYAERERGGDQRDILLAPREVAVPRIIGFPSTTPPD
jgi:hypothetical protein